MWTSVDGSVEGEVWRALASPWRRALLDRLRSGPLTTGALAAGIPELSRYAVMQHLGVLEAAGLVLVERRGRERFNHLNPVPLRRWYERWVVPMADSTAASLLALQRAAETPEGTAMTSTAVDASVDATDPVQVRTVRLETELRIRATPERLFQVVFFESASWFPHSYGGERTQRIVVEPRVGGLHYEDWGDGAGYLYGNVTAYDPPRMVSLRGRIMAGSILDTVYTFAPDGDETILHVTKVAVGAMTEDEAASIRTYGDIANFADALRALVEG